MFDKHSELTRTQDLKKYYHDVGQFYWGTFNAWRNALPMHTSGIAVPLPSYRFVDIDTQEDWVRAELTANTLEMNN